MGNITVRKYISGDEKQIIRLFHEVFKKHMGKTESFKHWNWEYKKNPNKQLFILLATDNDKVVGHYSVIPVKMKIKNEELITSLSLDTMTHEDYRGKGIFPLLANKLYKEIGKMGIPITYGFPNKYSIKPIIKKCGWFEITDLPIYVLPLNFTNLINRYIKSRFFSKYVGNLLNFLTNLFLKKYKIPNRIKIHRITEFDKSFDDLWNLIKKELKIGVIRDSNYLNWRYIQKPEDNYNIFVIKDKKILKGYIILKTEVRYGLRIGLIIDLLTVPSQFNYENYLINYSIFYFKKKRADIITIIMFPHSRYFEALIHNKFIKMIKFLFPEEIHFGVRKNDNKIDFKLFKNPTNWYLTWGDTDVV